MTYLWPAGMKEPYLIAVPIWGFPKIRGAFLGVPIIRTIRIILGHIFGSPIYENHHVVPENIMASMLVAIPEVRIAKAAV